MSLLSSVYFIYCAKVQLYLKKGDALKSCTFCSKMKINCTLYVLAFHMCYIGFSILFEVLLGTLELCIKHKGYLVFLYYLASQLSSALSCTNRTYNLTHIASTR